MNYKTILESEWKPIDGMMLEDNALDAIKTEKNVLVIAGPGAGKTELLAQKACFLLQTSRCVNPRKILAISFKKDAADNLKTRVEKRCGKDVSERFISMTYDAFSKRLLDSFRNSLDELIRPASDYLIGDNKYIKLAFEKAGFINQQKLSPRNLNNFFYNQLANVNIPLNQSGIREKAWLLLIKGDDEIKPCLTFQMISKLAEYIIRTNNNLKKAMLFTYSHVFLDEFQDTTEIQYNLVKTLFMKTDTNITAVGDNKQRIMIWAGALLTAFDDYRTNFSALDKPLFMNHRSAPRLVSLQRMMYASLQDDHKAIQASDKWGANEGVAKLYKFNDMTTEANVIAKDIYDRRQCGIELNDICILTKQLPKVYTDVIIEQLKKLGIRARIENEYQDLLKEPITLLILSFLGLSVKRKSPDEWEYIIYYLNYIYIGDFASKSNYCYTKQEELSLCSKKCKTKLNSCEDLTQFKEIIDIILEFYNIDLIRANYPIYKQGDYFQEVVNKLIELLWIEYGISNGKWDIAIKNFKGENSISIMTIHKSKGLEYQAIYFIGLEDSAFWNFRTQPMEDRCAFFVALSRAKQYVNFTFCKNRILEYSQVQNHSIINEFYQLLENSKIVEIITYDQ